MPNIILLKCSFPHKTFELFNHELLPLVHLLLPGTEFIRLSTTLRAMNVCACMRARAFSFTLPTMSKERNMKLRRLARCSGINAVCSALLITVCFASKHLTRRKSAAEIGDSHVLFAFRLICRNFFSSKG